MYQDNINNKIFENALSKLKLRFPVAEVSRQTGEAKGNVSSFIHGKKPVSDNFLDKVAKSFKIDIDSIREEIRKEEDRTFTPKNGLTFRELDNGQFTVAVPLIPFEAHAQYLSDIDEASILEDYEEVTFIVDKIGLGNYRAFKVKGDSMDGGRINDTIDGAVVLARELQKHHWRDGFRSTDYGWIIITQHNILFKDIINLNQTDGTITCHSRNPSPEYSDFDLALDDVFQIFKVIKRTF